MLSYYLNLINDLYSVLVSFVNFLILSHTHRFVVILNFENY